MLVAQIKRSRVENFWNNLWWSIKHGIRTIRTYSERLIFNKEYNSLTIRGYQRDRWLMITNKINIGRLKTLTRTLRRNPVGVYFWRSVMMSNLKATNLRELFGTRSIKSISDLVYGLILRRVRLERNRIV